jgi:hypothetical protein
MPCKYSLENWSGPSLLYFIIAHQD